MSNKDKARQDSVPPDKFRPRPRPFPGETEQDRKDRRMLRDVARRLIEVVRPSPGKNERIPAPEYRLRQFLGMALPVKGFDDCQGYVNILKERGVL